MRECQGHFGGALQNLYGTAPRSAARASILLSAGTPAQVAVGRSEKHRLDENGRSIKRCRN